MGIYLLNMKMPEEPTPITIYPDGRWMDFTDGRYGMLTEIPPHGDLIDANKLVELCDIMADKCDGIGVSVWHQFKTTVEWSPIVIPAEPPKEES